MALNYKQAMLSFCIIISIWVLHVTVLTIITPKNFVSSTGFYIFISQPTLMGICELFLLKNCMKLVFSKFSDNKFALNQLLSVNVPVVFYKVSRI